MADCKVSSTRDDAERAICRLVEVTSGHGTHGIRYFGPGCLVKIENTEFLHSVGTPKSKYFLVASKEVLAKGHLEALKKREEQRREHKSTVKMMAEFPELKDKRKLQRLPLDELYVSIEEDVFQLHGITYVALSKWEKRRFGKSSLLNRALDVVSTEQEETSTMLTSDQLQCLVFCGESTMNTVGDKNVFELSTRVYDLLHVDSVLASNSSESGSSSYFLRNEEKQRFLREDQFEENERPFGSIILSKDYKLAGMLNFINNNPVPVIVGTGSGTEATGACGVFSHSSQEASVLPKGFKAGKKHDVTEKEVHAGASGGIYPLLDSQSKYEVGTEATNKTDVSTLPQPAVTAPTGNQFVAGLEDGSKSEESSGDCGATADPQQSLPGVDGAQGAVQDRTNPEFEDRRASSPTENSCRSFGGSSSSSGQDFKGIKYVVNLPQNGVIKEEPAVEDVVPADQPEHQADVQSQAQGAAGDLLPDQIQGRSRDSSQSQEIISSDRPDAPNIQGYSPVQPSTLEDQPANRADDQSQAQGAAGDQPPQIQGTLRDSSKSQERISSSQPDAPNIHEHPPVQRLSTPADRPGNQADDQSQACAAASDLLPQIQGTLRDSSESQERCSFPPDAPNIEECLPVQPSSTSADQSGNQADVQRQLAHVRNSMPQIQERPRDLSKSRERSIIRSYPPYPPNKQEHPPVQRSSSVLGQSAGGTRQFKLSDLLTPTLLGSLDVLEGSSRCLDQEYRYGQCKCWKHLAECFGVPQQEYENFKCNQVHSPTEVMFEYLQSVMPEITVGALKDGLAQIDRQDVTDILLKHEQWDPSALNDATFVGSLFDSDPDIIGEMAVLLDRQKPGLKNWTNLAAKLGLTRAVFKTFESSSIDNPTETFFDIVKVKFPKMTVGELIGHLEAMQRRDVINAINESTSVTECSVIKDLIDDLDVMDNVCELFNTKKRAVKVKGLKHLGKKLKIEKETLDDLLPVQEETQSPTEALIRHLGGKYPGLTLENFIWAVHSIDRPDVITVLEVYLPDGCIPNLLKSCGCEQCKESKLKQNREGH